jgi:hypothetical protein
MADNDDREWQIRREGAVIFIAEHTRHGHLPRDVFEQAWDWREGAGHELLEDLLDTARARVTDDGDVQLTSRSWDWLASYQTKPL